MWLRVFVGQLKKMPKLSTLGRCLTRGKPLRSGNHAAYAFFAPAATARTTQQGARSRHVIKPRKRELIVLGHKSACHRAFYLRNLTLRYKIGSLLAFSATIEMKFREGNLFTSNDLLSLTAHITFFHISAGLAGKFRCM
jgi:hypothetical protein